MFSSTSITNCTNNGEIVGKAEGTGGIVGWANHSSEIMNCVNNGQVTGGSRTGGIVGNAGWYTSILDCYNTGNIKGTDNVGGCVGVTWSNVENCYNTGNVQASAEYAGGVIGEIGSANDSSETITVSIKHCYNTGNVTADFYVGGVIGWISETNTAGTVENIYNSGKIEGNATMGGLIGRHGMTITVTRGYNKGEVIVKENGTGSEVGALIGQKRKDTSLLSHLYYLNTITLQAIGNVYQASTDEERQPPDTVTSVTDNLNSFEEFLNWIQQK